MTLQEFFNLLGDNPVIVITYFLMIPVTAILAGILGKGEGHLSPWRYLYSTLIYLVCVPGIFAITLTIYLFLFERRSILDTDLYTQVLPVISTLATLLIIRKNVNLDYVPGFDKMSGLVMMITVTLGFMWFLDRMRIFAFTYIPFHYVILLFIAFFLVFRYGWSALMRGSK